MDNVLNNSLCLTHGGTLGALYGILSGEKISSTNALEARGDRINKFTDPERKFTQEDNYLFFESIIDRGRLTYSGFVEPNSGPGFAFLLVASGKSLLNQVDMAGDSDGVLLGRQDGQPLEINLKEVDYKILIPDSYEKEIKQYCSELKQLGINPPEHLLEFRSMIELKQLVHPAFSEDTELTQQLFCDNIGLNAIKSDKNFNRENKVIETKTSRISTSCAEPLPNQYIEKIELDSAEALLKHMKERPTIANVQRNTLIMFNESVTDKILSNKIKGITNGKPLVLDFINKPEDLAYCLNSLGKNHYSKDTLNNGEKRMSSNKVWEIMESISPYVEEHTKQGLRECLNIITKKDISPEECQNLLKKPELIQEKEWYLGINGVQYANQSTEEIKQLINLHPDKIISVWKAGMSAWTNVKEMELFNPIQDPPEEIKEWYVGIDKVQQPNNHNTEEIKELIKQNPDKQIHIWKAGMESWKDVKEMELFNPIPNPPEEIKEILFTPKNQENVLNSISHFREKLKEKTSKVDNTRKFQY